MDKVNTIFTLLSNEIKIYGSAELYLLHIQKSKTPRKLKEGKKKLCKLLRTHIYNKNNKFMI